MKPDVHRTSAAGPCRPAPCAIACAICSTIAFGVPFGAKRPMKFCETGREIPPPPPSECRALPQAASRSSPRGCACLPVLCSSNAWPLTLCTSIGMCPLMRSVKAGPAPRYGTCAMSVLVSDLNRSPTRWLARADARRSVGQLAGIGLGVVGELLQRPDRQRRMHIDERRIVAEHGDRLEILDRIVGQARRRDRIDDQPGVAAEQDGVAVRLARARPPRCRASCRRRRCSRRRPSRDAVSRSRPRDGRWSRRRPPGG